MNVTVLAFVLLGVSFVALTAALFGLASCWRENEQLQVENYKLWRENGNVWQALTSASRCLELDQVAAAQRALANARTRAADEGRP